MFRRLQMTPFEGCCAGSIVSGFGGDSDKPIPESDAEIREQLVFARQRRNVGRGFTVLVMTQAQRDRFKRLLEEEGYQRISAWMNYRGATGGLALFMARHQHEGMGTVNRHLNNRAKGARV